VDRWTHLAITWDRGTKKAGIYVDGRLDVAETPEGVTEGVLGGGLSTLRLGGHTWQSPAPNLNGLLDEVRVSSVVREYRPLAGSEKVDPGATAVKPRREGSETVVRRSCSPGAWTRTRRTYRSRTSKRSLWQRRRTTCGRRNDGRPQLPHADGCGDEFGGRVLSDLGVQPGRCAWRTWAKPMS